MGSILDAEIPGVGSGGAGAKEGLLVSCWRMSDSEETDSQGGVIMFARP